MNDFTSLIQEVPQEAYGGRGQSAAMTPGKPNQEEMSLSQQERPSSLPVSLDSAEWERRERERRDSNFLFYLLIFLNYFFGPLMREDRTGDRTVDRMRVGNDMQETGHRYDSNLRHMIDGKPHRAWGARLSAPSESVLFVPCAVVENTILMDRILRLCASLTKQGVENEFWAS